MNGLYIAHEVLSSDSGVSKKIIAQRDGFKKNGVNMHLCSVHLSNNNRSYFIDGKFLFSLGSGCLATIKYYTLFSPILRFIKVNDISFVYIRYIHIATPFYIIFLRKLKKMGVSVFLEIPTYPYDAEHANVPLRHKVIDLIERQSRNKFAKYVDRIVTVQDYDQIFGVPTIKISNGIDFNTIPLRTCLKHKGYNFVGVAQLATWHAYDRLIKGIGEYYKNGGTEDIHFYIIGDNDSLIKEYLKIAQNYNIVNRIFIEGVKRGDELNHYFDNADLAVGSLGFHRIGLVEGKPLKCIEYAARGIPFIYSNINSDFDNKDFIWKVPADDTPIIIEDIILFLKKLDQTPLAIRDSIDERATWKYQMSLVVKEIKR
jgi:glycosyltransferase involved in cell wall biosynthesis